MRIEQHLGFLQEELHKFNYDIEVFDEVYLIDKIIEYCATINREAINSNEGKSTLFSTVNKRLIVNQPTHKLNSGTVTVWSIPKLLTGVLWKNTNGLTVITSETGIGGISHMEIGETFMVGGSPNTSNAQIFVVGRSSLLNILTNKAARYSSTLLSYCIIDNEYLIIDNLIASSILEDGNDILFQCVLDDQRVNLDENEEVLQMELKCASDVKLHMLIKKDITSLISGGQDGSKDNRERSD